MANGQQINSATGTLVGIGGDGNQAVTGSAATSAAGTATLNRLLPLRSRKQGTGSAISALIGSSSQTSSGLLDYFKSFALTGQASATAMGTMLYRGTAILAWNAPTTDVGGGALTGLAGYQVKHNTTGSTTIYPDVQDVGNVLTYQWSGLLPGQTHYFVVTAYDLSLNEGPASNQISKAY